MFGYALFFYLVHLCHFGLTCSQMANLDKNLPGIVY